MLDFKQCSYGGCVMRTAERAISVLVLGYNGTFEAKMKYREALEKIKPESLNAIIEAGEFILEAREEVASRKD
jgi:hypothetical protein